MPYQVNASTETTLGLVVPYLGPVGTQIPHSNATILRDPREVLTVLGECHCPRIEPGQVGCPVSVRRRCPRDGGKLLPDAVSSADQ